MEVRYKREINHNYMILDAPSQGGGYECRMLASNSIKGLLKFRVRQYEEKREFYYEITSRQPLRRLLEQRKISGGELRSLLLGIASVITRIEEYLLKEEQILLDPEFIYIDPDHFTVYLCLLPGYSCDFPAALSKLLQYFLEKMNHQDREGVVMAYNLYQESLRENYGMADLLRHLTVTEDIIFEEKMAPDRCQELGEENNSYLPGSFRGRGEKAEDAEFERRRSEKIERRRPEKAQENMPEEKFTAVQPKDGRIKKILQMLLLLAAAEGAVWYFIGTEGLIRYGIWIAAAAALLGAAALMMPDGRWGAGREGNIREEITEEEEMWRFKPESTEEFHQRKVREERREEKHSKENGTILLAEQEIRSEQPVLESLEREEKNIEIAYVPYVIGKNPELADYCLQRPTVSRLHLRVDKKEGVFIVTDLNSTNGTVVEGYRLQANETVSIRNGDVIAIADIKYRFLEKNIEICD